MAESYNIRVSKGAYHLSVSGGGEIETIPGGWKLSIPKGSAGNYRNAQIDNYNGLSRNQFTIQPGTKVSARLKASSNNSPGTWGMGIWNDPFGFNIAFGGQSRLPILPNAAWFFFPAAQNHLTFSDAQYVSHAHVGIFSSKSNFGKLIAMGPLILWRPTARWLRKQFSKFIREDGASIDIDASKWHEYELAYEKDSIRFRIDGKEIYSTNIAVKAPLGLVIWIDNQYSAWHSNGKMKYGTLASEDFWLEIKELNIHKLK